MKKKILAVFLSLCVAMSLLPTAAMAAPTDGSTVVRIQDTESWYPDATRAFMTKETYWFDQVTAQPAGYVVDESGKTVSISTPEALVWWAKQVNQGNSFEGYTVCIMADLDMSAHYWTPICTGKYEENGAGKWVVTENNVLDNTTICGNGHTITGLATSTGLRGPNQDSKPGDGSNCYYDAAFIGYSCCDIKICDLAFDGARIAITEPFDEVTKTYGSSMVAVVVGAQNKGSLTLNNVTVNNADVLAMQKASAFVGNLMGNSTLTVNKCAVTNSTFSAYFMVAPIASYGATTQVKVNGIQLKNNTINVVEQASQTYSYDETLRAEYWDGDLNASTTTVFYDTTKPLVSVAELDGYGFVNLGDAITAAETGDTIMLLSDVAVDTTITVDKNVTINLNGYTITGVSRSGDSAIGRRVFYVTEGTLNLTGEGTVTTAGRNDETFKDSSSVIRVGDGSDYTRTESLKTAGLVIGSDVTISAPASYGVGAFGGDTKETLDVYGKVISTSSVSAVSGNGQDINSDTTINIHDGAVITAEKAVAIYHPQAGAMTIGAATITGTGGIEAKGGLTTISVENAIIKATGELQHTENNNGTSSDGYAIAAVENENYAGEPSIHISSGYYTGPVAVLRDNDITEEKVAVISVTGGYFTNDPSDYVANGYVAGESNNPEYAYQVVEGAVTEAPAEVVPAAPDVDIGDLSGTDATAVSAALTGVEAELTPAANAQANKNTVTEDQAKQALSSAGISTGGKTITVVVQPYLEITVEDYANNGTKELSLNITPMYRTVATTADLNKDEIKIADGESGRDDANAVEIPNQGGILPVTQSVVISIPLPSGFVNSTSDIYVQHKNYEYTAQVTSDDKEPLTYTATFTNPHGFSVFTISTTSQAIANVDSTSYTSLQSAVNAAQSGDTITVTQVTDPSDLIATTKKDIQIRNATKEPITVTINGQDILIEAGKTYSYDWVYIPPANPNYRIDIPDFEGGTVTADPAAAKAGATVTLTATPDEGYAVGTITVTDRFGDAVKVTEQADGTYTFTMPNGQVTVKATFVETQEPAPAEPFPDVDENDWFYDEVVYVYENGLMNGVENNQFAPNTATNRAMLATILYRLAGEPAVSGDLPFTDVESGTWYTDAVLWAAQNGIVNGLGENTFAPMNTLTREQLVTMLYRYAEAEGYDVSAAADLSGYPDAGKVQPYAQEAMSWAVAEGIVEGMDGNLNPAGSATRAQIATILMRFCEGVAK